MNRTDKIFRLGELFPGKSEAVQSLHRLLGDYDRLQVLLCNGEGWWHGFDVSEYDQETEEPSPLRRYEEKQEIKIKALIAEIDPALTVDFGGDPRGYCVRIFSHVGLYKDCLSWLFYY